MSLLFAFGAKSGEEPPYGVKMKGWVRSEVVAVGSLLGQTPLLSELSGRLECCVRNSERLLLVFWAYLPLR